MHMTNMSCKLKKGNVTMMPINFDIRGQNKIASNIEEYL